MLKKAVPLIVTIALLAGLIGSGCKSLSSAAVSEQPIPDTANLLASVQIHQLLTDEDLIQAYDEAEKDPQIPQTFAETMAQFEHEAGIDPLDYLEAVIFANTASEDGYWGAIVRGAFDEAALIQAVELATQVEMTPSDYHGYQVYIDEEQKNALSFLSDTEFVIGTVAAVRGVLDVETGDAQRLSGAIVNTFNALSGSLLRVAVGTPAKWTEEINREDTPVGYRLLKSITAVGAAVSKSGEDVTIETRIQFVSPIFAGALAFGLWNLKTFVPRVFDMSPEAETTLKKIKLAVRGASVRISMTSTVDELIELFQTME